jgi:glycosyltransferase involved in cell wall biosynthesis
VNLPDAVVVEGLGYQISLDVAAWTEQLATLLEHGPWTAKEGERARRWVAERYTWHRIGSELARRYQWVLAGCLDEPAPMVPAPQLAASAH